MLSYLFFARAFRAPARNSADYDFGDWEQTLLLLITALVYGFPFLVMPDAGLLRCPISATCFKQRVCPDHTSTFGTI